MDISKAESEGRAQYTQGPWFLHRRALPPQRGTKLIFISFFPYFICTFYVLIKKVIIFYYCGEGCAYSSRRMEVKGQLAGVILSFQPELKLSGLAASYSLPTKPSCQPLFLCFRFACLKQSLQTITQAGLEPVAVPNAGVTDVSHHAQFKNWCF